MVVCRHIISLLCFSYCIAEQMPSFRIVAPQVICEPGTNQTIDTSPQTATINFQPKDGVKLQYHVRIYFVVSGGGKKSQRHTLMLWRAIRLLERRINVQESSKITDRNLVIINKTELMPGVSYTFEVTGQTNGRALGSPQNFTINFSNGVLERESGSKEALGANFLLLGSERTYANIPYILNAKLTFCKPRFDYYFQWRVAGIDKSFEKYTHTPKSQLKLKENIFEGGKSYRIDVSALQSTTSEEIIKDFIFVEVLERGFEIFLIPFRATTGVNKPINLFVSILDYDNRQNTAKIFWSCRKEDNEVCEDDLSKFNGPRIEIKFRKTGTYYITSTVNINNAMRRATAEIGVFPDLIVNWNFDNISMSVTPVDKPFEFVLVLNDLVPNCKAEWISVQDQPYSTINVNLIPGGIGNFTVTDIEENFLSEIADFDNSTISRQSKLSIPAKNKSGWNGLKGNEKYVFRLLTKCPPPIDDIDIRSATARNDNQNKDIVTFFDILVATNSPPVTLPLEVRPAKGYALQTVFQLLTGTAKDDAVDSPLKYTFMITFDKYTITVGEYYENKAVDVQLPYAGNPIQTSYKVCDSRNACTTVTGPAIKTEMPTFTAEQNMQIALEITNAFLRMDFSTGNQLILMSAVTFKNLNDTTIYNQFKQFAIELLTKEVQKQSERPSEKFHVDEEDILQFVKQTKLNLLLLEANSASVMQQLLDLLDSIALDEDDINEVTSIRRKKRQADFNDDNSRTITDADYVYTSLELIERILQNANESVRREEETKLVRKVNQFVNKMCGNTKILKEEIDTSLVTVILQKLMGYQIQSQKFPFSKDNDVTEGIFTLTSPAIKRNVKYCLVSMKYSRDYLSGQDRQPIYSVLLYEHNRNGKLNKMDIGLRNGNTLVVDIPYTNTSQCVMWSSNNWSAEDCITYQNKTSLTTCKCRRDGILKLNAVANLPTTQLTSPTPTATKVNTVASTHQFVLSSVSSQIVAGSPQTKPPITSAVAAAKSTTAALSKPTIPATTLATTTNAASTKLPPASTVSPTSSMLVNNTTNQTTKKVATASVLEYVIPSVCFILLIVVLVGVFIYRRRRQSLTTFANDLEIVTRDSRPGIKYARFYDEHLMIGNFDS